MPKIPSLPSLKEHIAEWAECRRCGLCESRKTVVLGKGLVPCDVLFIGEAPGASEDAIGKPFVGPAGKKLDAIIKRAMPVKVTERRDGSTEYQLPALRLTFTNLVACIPKEAGEKGQPLPEEIRACKPRLEEFIRLCSPRLIVAVGTLARDCLDPKVHQHVRVPEGVPVIDVIHPAAILRANVAQQGLMTQRAAVTLANAFEELR